MGNVSVCLLLTAISVLLVFANVSHGLDNGVGLVPAMGWNSWNYFRCQINETLIREVADAMVSSGLRDAGYKYVNLDDCWMQKRDGDGRIVPFADKFPSGMKALADYVHSKGLLFGVYSDTGNHTCEGYPGSWGYEELDARTYAEWGVDYLKYDYCGMEKTTVSVQASYEKMRDALNASGRPILYSLCSWGSGQPWQWGKQVGNSWRVGIDLFAVWDDSQARSLMLPSFLQPVMGALHAVEQLSQHAGPGGFNDPDMLVVGLEGMYPYGVVQQCPPHIKGCKPGDYISKERWGRVGGLTLTEQRTHFAFWCMLASPLILGNDPRHMTKATLAILTAPDLLAISQDPLAQQAKKVWSSASTSIWTRPLADGRQAVLLFNAGATAVDITCNWAAHLPQQARQWARQLPGADPECRDSLDGCKVWAAAGECEKNPGFMLSKCLASCPEACPRPLGDPGPKATALVRDAWHQDDLGPHVALFTAHLVEPHEARVLLLTFVEPTVAQQWQAQVG
ncbi:glycoside hydrolase superfamily [Haematococcus lacustris]